MNDNIIPLPTKSELLVRHRIIWHGGDRRIITKVISTPSPQTCGTIRGVVAYGGSAQVELISDSDPPWRSTVPESILYNLPWKISDRMADPAETEALEKQFEENKRDRETAKVAAEKAKQEAIERGRPIIAELLPPWATHVIIANLEASDCDSMTDYYASHTTRTLLLAWSRHGRDLFPEMRKAALNAEETKHLGPGCDDYGIWIYTEPDQGPNRHRQGYKYEGSWPTREAAQAEVDRVLAEEEAERAIKGFSRCTFREGYSINYSSIEHREKYSMGHGYYLGRNRYSGWQISKQTIGTKTDWLALIAGKGDCRIPSNSTAKSKNKMRSNPLKVGQPKGQTPPPVITNPPASQPAATTRPISRARAVAASPKSDKPVCPPATFTYLLQQQGITLSPVHSLAAFTAYCQQQTGDWRMLLKPWLASLASTHATNTPETVKPKSEPLAEPSELCSNTRLTTPLALPTDAPAWLHERNRMMLEAAQRPRIRFTLSQTVAALHNKWDELATGVQKLREEVAPKIKAVKDQIAVLHGQKDKVAEINRLCMEQRNLEWQPDYQHKCAEDDFMEALNHLAADYTRIAKERQHPQPDELVGSIMEVIYLTEFLAEHADHTLLEVIESELAEAGLAAEPKSQPQPATAPTSPAASTPADHEAVRFRPEEPIVVASSQPATALPAWRRSLQTWSGRLNRQLN